MNQLLRVVCCEPGKPAEVREIEPGLAGLHSVLHGGPIDVLRVPNGLDLWIHDEARLNYFEDKSDARWLPNKLVLGPLGYHDLLGPIVCAMADENGDTIGFTPEQAERVRAWLDGADPETCRDLRADEVGEPGMHVSFF